MEWLKLLNISCTIRLFSLFPAASPERSKPCVIVIGRLHARCRALHFARAPPERKGSRALMCLLAITGASCSVRLNSASTDSGRNFAATLPHRRARNFGCFAAHRQLRAVSGYAGWNWLKLQFDESLYPDTEIMTPGAIWTIQLVPFDLSRSKFVCGL